MHVYVDELFVSVSTNPVAFKIGDRTGHRWCRLWADNPADLQAFAKQIGVSAFWYQDHPVLPHYRLTPGLRDKALQYGARNMDRTAFDRMLREREEELKVQRWLSGEAVELDSNPTS